MNDFAFYLFPFALSRPPILPFAFFLLPLEAVRFVFSGKFYILFAIGLVPLSLSWNFPALRWAVLAYDILLIAAAVWDHRVGRRRIDGLTVTRRFDGRAAIGDPTAFDTRSTQPLVSLNSYLPWTIGIQIWMPRLPVVLG